MTAAAAAAAATVPIPTAQRRACTRVSWWTGYMYM